MTQSTHEKHLKDKYFQQINEGIKTVEIRLDKGSSRNIKEGDTIIFYNDVGEEVKCSVTEIIVMDSIRVALDKFLDKALPDITFIDEGVDLYREIYGDNILDTKVICIFISKL